MECICIVIHRQFNNICILGGSRRILAKLLEISRLYVFGDIQMMVISLYAQFSIVQKWIGEVQVLRMPVFCTKVRLSLV